MSARRPKWPRGACGCRNHVGSQKVKYRSQAAAVHAILTRHRKHGPHRTYRCPRQPGVWHVASVRSTP